MIVLLVALAVLWIPVAIRVGLRVGAAIRLRESQRPGGVS